MSSLQIRKGAERPTETWQLETMFLGSRLQVTPSILCREDTSRLWPNPPDAARSAEGLAPLEHCVQLPSLLGGYLAEHLLEPPHHVKGTVGLL